MMKATVTVRLKPGVLDPQGVTISKALQSMGYDGIGDVRAGKVFELTFDDGDESTARTKAEEIAHRLLANPVIETYSIEVTA
jgi:phosphoribosylformylglycinamidine synthase